MFVKIEDIFPLRWRILCVFVDDATAAFGRVLMVRSAEDVAAGNGLEDQRADQNPRLIINSYWNG